MWYANISRYIHVSMFFISRNATSIKTVSPIQTPPEVSPPPSHLSTAAPV